MSRYVDVAVIGAGIVGCMVARELSRYQLDAVVLEKAGDVGEGASKANSGLIHAGFHPREGSLKGRSCTQGNALFGEICHELDIPLRRIGSLFVAFHEDGCTKIEEKRYRGEINGITNLEIITGDRARELEPGLSEKVISALWAPSTGIISPFQLILATSRNAFDNGVRFRFNAEVAKIERDAFSEGDGGYRLHLTSGEIVFAHYVVNCAGEEADLMDTQVHPADLVIRPRRGQYLVFDKQGNPGVQHVLYQAQESDEGGTLLTPTIDGNLLAGPTSENVRDYHLTATTADGLAHVERVARKLLPDLDIGEVISSFAGVRANIKNVDKEHKDFIVRVSAPHFVSVLGIKNPGMTSSPILAKVAIEKLAEEGLRLESDTNFQVKRTGQRPFMECSPSRQSELLASDPSYGHLICRCENVTEGDIRRILYEPLPPTTLDGVKKRLRTGMGRCHGSFCESRIVQILAHEWNIEPDRIVKGQNGGTVVARWAK